MGLFDIFSSDAGEQAAARQLAAQKKGYNKGMERVETGLNQATGYFQQGLDPYTSLLAGDMGANDMYRGALGLTGPEGVTAAQGAFQTSPGYQFMLDQGQQAINRNRASQGMLASGNTDIDTMKYSQGLANQEYQGWLSRLQGMDPRQTAAQRATILQNLGSMYGDTGRHLGEMEVNRGNTVGQYHQNVYGAQQGALQNQWGAIAGGLGLGAEALGGGLGKKLLSLF